MITSAIENSGYLRWNLQERKQKLLKQLHNWESTDSLAEFEKKWN